MEVALLTDVFRHADVHRAIAAIGDAGFSQCELNACFNWDPHLNLESGIWRADVAAIGRSAASAAVSIPAVACYPNLAATDADERARAVDYCRRGIQACVELGGRLITVMPGGNNLMPPDPQVQALVAALSAVCETACAYGVDVAIESYPGNCLEGTAAIAGLVRRLGCPRLGYLLCTAHLAARGEDLVDTYLRSKDVLRHIHFSDSRTATPYHQHLVPGLGDIRFDRLVEQLRTEGYAGTVTLQIYSHSAEPEAASRRALAAFRQFWPAR